MIVITCLDDRGGVMFNRRRQSQDRILRERIASMTAGGRLWMSRYSAGQFEGEALPNLTVDDDFLQKAAEGDYCFVEGAALAPFEARITGVILFRWNRTYPADSWFDLTLEPGRWRLAERAEFAGHSHDVITMEVYSG